MSLKWNARTNYDVWWIVSAPLWGTTLSRGNPRDGPWPLWRSICPRSAQGMGLEVIPRPPRCIAPRRHPQTRCFHWQDWATTPSDAHWDNYNTAQGTVHQRYFLHCGAWVRFILRDIMESRSFCSRQVSWSRIVVLSTYLSHASS